MAGVSVKRRQYFENTIFFSCFIFRPNCSHNEYEYRYEMKHVGVLREEL